MISSMAGSPYNSVVNLCQIQHPTGSRPEEASQLRDFLCAWVWAVGSIWCRQQSEPLQALMAMFYT